MDLLLLYTTWPDAQSAKSAAHQLLESRVVACANISAPVASLYRWEGAVEEAAEVVMILKTSRSTLQKAIDITLKIHPYTNPCVLTLPVEGGSAAFLQWIARETMPL